MADEQGCKEEVFLKKLASMHDLAEKKTKIYARLLMNTAIAKEMEELSLRHEKHKEELTALFCKKDKKAKGGEDSEA